MHQSRLSRGCCGQGVNGPLRAKRGLTHIWCVVPVVTNITRVNHQNDNRETFFEFFLAATSLSFILL
jgi:hypothetical protein